MPSLEASFYLQPVPVLPRSLIDDARKVEKIPFDPEKHLNFEMPKRILTLEELGFKHQGVSPNAVSDPFPLFTQEAIEQMRAEAFSEESLAECQVRSTFASNMIRGHCPKYAPFSYAAWHSPELLDAISRVAGIELVPAIDYDTAHLNISVNPDGTTTPPDVEGDEDISAFGWHKDCYPFVCVVMLSDCRGMVGGETMLRSGTGELIKVRGPTMGTAVIMQAAEIEHQALKARGGKERISMITSLRPKNPLVLDTSNLFGVRTTSDLSTLYYQFAEYRLENLEERIREEMRVVRKRRNARGKFDVDGTRKWLHEQQDFLNIMLAELR